MLVTIHSSSIIGIEAYPILIEVDAQKGLPATTVIGLPDTSVKESKDRAKSAIKNSNFFYPSRKITINLAPADLKKEGPFYDLPIALGILSATKQISRNKFNNFLIIGELSLDGSIKPIKGALSIASMCKKVNIQNLILPYQNAHEASAIKSLTIYPAHTLLEVCNFLEGNMKITPLQSSSKSFVIHKKWDIDFSDIKGQESVKRAIEVAVTGNHNILFIGPPGTGKTMLSKRIPTLLPPLTLEQAIETTKIHSMSGLLLSTQKMVLAPPFRCPHHTTSAVGLIGGGSKPKAGEVSLAHNGVLFLDELPEFSRHTLEVLRQPLEEGYVHITRALQSIQFPARFMLCCAMNPCPCGYLTHPTKQCQCSSSQIQRYLSKISGPLLDRIDMHIEVPSLNIEQLQNQHTGESSESIRKRIQETRSIQYERYTNESILFNAHLSGKKLKKHCTMNQNATNLLKDCVEQMQLSARAYDKIIKIGRTIADMENVENITEEHIAEAVQYRSLDTVYNSLL